MKPYTLIFLHLPKTAGTTLTTLLSHLYANEGVTNLIQRWNFTPEEQRECPTLGILRDATRSIEVNWDIVSKCGLVVGHFEYGIHKYFGHDCKYVTFLRDPFERMISEYRHAVRIKEHWNHQYIVSRNLSFADCVTSGVSVTVDNLYTRFLCGHMQTIPFGACSKPHFDEALANLRTFKTIGLTERFNESLILLALDLGINASEFEYSREKVGGKFDRQEFTGDRERLARFFKWDQQLYDFANNQVSERLDTLKATLHYDLKRLNRRVRLAEYRKAFRMVAPRLRAWSRRGLW
jgi:hypothetical protein